MRKRIASEGPTIEVEEIVPEEGLLVKLFNDR